MLKSWVFLELKGLKLQGSQLKSFSQLERIKNRDASSLTSASNDCSVERQRRETDGRGKQNTKVGLKTPFGRVFYTYVEMENLEKISRAKFTSILKEVNCLGSTNLVSKIL